VAGREALARLGLLAGSTLGVLALAEAGLRLAGYAPERFKSTARLVSADQRTLLDCYPTNPRGYFEIDLRTPDAPNKPELLSATYDAARGATVVRVRFEPTVRGLGSRLDLYASDSLSVFGYPEAERPIAETFRTGEFELVVPGDLRGQWITATGTPTVDIIFLRDENVPASATNRYTAYDTSELSDAIRVD